MFAAIQLIRGVITAATVLEATLHLAGGIQPQTHISSRPPGSLMNGVQVDIQAEVLYFQEFPEDPGRDQTSGDIETGFRHRISVWI